MINNGIYVDGTWGELRELREKLDDAQKNHNDAEETELIKQMMVKAAKLSCPFINRTNYLQRY